jgi:O-antigen ligase
LANRHYALVPIIDRGARRAARLALRGLAAVWSVMPTRFSVAFCAVGLLLGTLIGAMIAILPVQLLSIPGAVIGLIVVLIPLTFPELRRVPLGAATVMFFVYLVGELTLPQYLAVSAADLPWISILRMLFLGMAVPVIICISGSAEIRNQIKSAISAEKPVSYAVFALFIAFALSLPLSRSPFDSVRHFLNLALICLVPFFSCILMLNSERRQEMFLRTFIFCAMFTVALSCLEFVVKHRLWLLLVPPGVIENNPSFATVLTSSFTRDGRYRASAHFNVPLSYGEYCSLIFPIALYFTLYARRIGDRLLGACGIAATMIGVFVANARGGVVGMIAGTGVFFILYSVNAIFRKKGSLVGPFLIASLPIAFSLVPIAMLSSYTFYKMVLGGAEVAGSTDARSVQWHMAWPHFLSRPITGYGLANAPEVIGYMGSFGGYSVDSYILSLLIDTGIVGLVAFFGMIGILLWRGAMVYFRDPNPASAKAIAMVAAFAAFALQRAALSQIENFTNIFMFLGFFVALRQQLRAPATAMLATDSEPVPAPRYSPSTPAGARSE